MSTPDNAALIAMIAAKMDAERQAGNLLTRINALTFQLEGLQLEHDMWSQSVVQLSAAIDGMTPA